MFKKAETSKDVFIVTAVSTVLFYMLAHGHRFTNTYFSGDSLTMIYQNDSAWQIALGRFMNPIWVMLRGTLLSPFLISSISLVFFVLAVYFLVDFLEIKRTLSIAMIAAVMTCNVTILSLNSTFMLNSDFYAVALFLAVFGVWLMKRDKLIWGLLGALSIAISLGTYQAYVCVAITMVMVFFLLKLQGSDTFKSICIWLGKYLGYFALAAIAYLGIWKVFQKIFGIWTANTYNGMAAVGEISLSNIGELIANAYVRVFQYFWYPEVFVTMPFRGENLSIVWEYLLRFCNLAVVLVIIGVLIIQNVQKKTNWWKRLLQIVILLLFPLGINFVCVISQGMEHSLMMFAFCFVYILAVKVAEGVTQQETPLVKVKKGDVFWLATLGILAVVTWSNIVYSNQVYLKKDLQDKAALSLMTRVVYDIESMEDYVVGETPVAFYGGFANSPCIKESEAFAALQPYGTGNTAFTYIGTEYAYLQHILNVNMNLVRVGDEQGVIANMPCYPEEGSIAYMDGTLVVKISDL